MGSDDLFKKRREERKKRKYGYIQPKANSYLIVTEGEKTEPLYLRGTVGEYIRTNNFKMVDAIKRDILTLYENDFRKIDQTGRISMLFGAIPAELNKNSSRYQVSSVISGKRANLVLEQIAEMQVSQTVNVAYHGNDPN